MEKFHGAWIDPHGHIYWLKDDEEHESFIQQHLEPWQQTMSDSITTAIRDGWCRISMSTGKGKYSIMCYDIDNDSYLFDLQSWAEKMIERFPGSGEDSCYLFDGIINHKMMTIKQIANMFNEKHIKESYPSHFDLEHFKTLNTFKYRYEYCKNQAPLEYICSGSSRYVFRIDNEKVLKLAKNKKGLVQNDMEVQLFEDPYAPSCLAPIHDYDSDLYTWLEMSWADKLTSAKFKKIMSFSWEDYIKALKNLNCLLRAGGIEESFENEQLVTDSDLYKGLEELLSNFDYPLGDYTRMSTYGIINNEIVLIDYGFSRETAKIYRH